MYEGVFTNKGGEDKLDFSQAGQGIIFYTAVEQLSHEPATPTRSRKPLRPNELSRWEVRAGNYRIFYDVAKREQKVTVKAVGMKRHNALLIRGTEYRL